MTLGFTTAPQSVLVSTGGGHATRVGAGRPVRGQRRQRRFAQLGDGRPSSPAAARSISVSTDGGDLQIGPA